MIFFFLTFSQQTHILPGDAGNRDQHYPEHTQLLDWLGDYCSSNFLWSKSQSRYFIYATNNPLSEGVYVRTVLSVNASRAHRLTAHIWREGRPVCALSIWKTDRMTVWEICRGTMEPDQSGKEDWLHLQCGGCCHEIMKTLQLGVNL